MMKEAYGSTLSKHDFDRLSRFIMDTCGIKMPELKKTMLESRLHKRLIALNLVSFKAYVDHVINGNKEGELVHMIDAVTTNKTDFFRESVHFDFLSNELLPMYEGKRNRQVRIWSAACSSGEEPYTMAMVLQEFYENNFAIDYSILATDISTKILQKAIEAIYTEERTIGIPLAIKRKYFLRSKDPVKKTLRIVPELRRKVSFQRLNFMDTTYDVNQFFDIIFCRNALIYFDKPTQEKVVNRLCQKLHPGGYLFLGHSESINDLNVPLKQIRPTIYVKI
jgi:chemotaxis protein methyltransferase CheR